MASPRHSRCEMRYTAASERAKDAVVDGSASKAWCAVNGGRVVALAALVSFRLFRLFRLLPDTAKGKEMLPARIELATFRL